MFHRRCDKTINWLIAQNEKLIEDNDNLRAALATEDIVIPRRLEPHQGGNVYYMDDERMVELDGQTPS